MIKYITIEEYTELSRANNSFYSISFIQEKDVYTDSSILHSIQDHIHYDPIKVTYVTVKPFDDKTVIIEAWQEHWKRSLLNSDMPLKDGRVLKAEYTEELLKIKISPEILNLQKAIEDEFQDWLSKNPPPHFKTRYSMIESPFKNSNIWTKITI